jgi:hypothetical protein
MSKVCCNHNCRQGRDCPLRARPAPPVATMLASTCTRCGGAHPLSQCSWPLINK